MSEKIAFTLLEAAEAAGYSKSVIERAVANGDMVARYANTKPVIERTELLRWLQSLPTESPKRVA